MVTSLRISAASTLYLVHSSKELSADSLIVSSFLLFAAFKKEDSGFDEVRKKKHEFSGACDITGPVSALRNSVTLTVFFFFLFKLFIKVLMNRCSLNCSAVNLEGFFFF